MRCIKNSYPISPIVNCGLLFSVATISLFLDGFLLFMMAVSDLLIDVNASKKKI